jgi:hypothetical protein
MKKAILLFGLFLAITSHASLDSLNIKGKIVSFDLKTVTIEIAGENYKFNREKLGKNFSSLKRGEAVEIAVEKKSPNK